MIRQTRDRRPDVFPSIDFERLHHAALGRNALCLKPPLSPLAHFSTRQRVRWCTSEPKLIITRTALVAVFSDVQLCRNMRVSRDEYVFICYCARSDGSNIIYLRLFTIFSLMLICGDITCQWRSLHVSIIHILRISRHIKHEVCAPCVLLVCGHVFLMKIVRQVVHRVEVRSEYPKHFLVLCLCRIHCVTLFVSSFRSGHARVGVNVDTEVTSIRSQTCCSCSQTCSRTSA